MAVPSVHPIFCDIEEEEKITTDILLPVCSS